MQTDAKYVCISSVSEKHSTFSACIRITYLYTFWDYPCEKGVPCYSTRLVYTMTFVIY